MPGCALLQSAELSGSLLTSTGPVSASFSLPVPSLPGLIGVCVYLQGWACAPDQDTAGVIVINRVARAIGNT